MKRPPSLLLNLGEPKPGFKKLSDIIVGNGVTVRSYRNRDADGHDRVDDVPFTLSNLPYQHIAPLIDLAASPIPDDPWGFFAYHHGPLYRSAMLKLNPVPTLGPNTGDVEIVNHIVGIYAYPGEEPITWDHFDDGRDGDKVCWGFKQLPCADLVVFRGSTTLEDWFRDFDCLATPWGQPGLGPVHPGFYLGIKDVWAEVQTMLRPGMPWVSAGHSLGAGRASILAGLACLD